jgi:hypothetical protein
LEEQELLVEVTYCGTDREACARLVVDPVTFTVSEAAWEKYRAPEEAGCKALSLPQLAGIEAYFNSGAALREALAPLQDACANGLFAEAVRGVIQAETFLFKERGFSTPEAYEDNWNTLYVNSCRYYSNLERVTQGWYEHVGYSSRGGSLFNRMKTQVLYLKGNSYLLTGHLNDSFHGVSVELELEKDKLMVKSARGDLLRAPDRVCGEAAGLMKELKGKNLGGIKKKDIALLLGGGNGCVHLIDLVSDGLETLELGERAKTF